MIKESDKLPNSDQSIEVNALQGASGRVSRFVHALLAVIGLIGLSFALRSGRTEEASFFVNLSFLMLGLIGAVRSDYRGFTGPVLALLVTLGAVAVSAGIGEAAFSLLPLIAVAPMLLVSSRVGVAGALIISIGAPVAGYITQSESIAIEAAKVAVVATSLVALALFLRNLATRSVENLVHTNQALSTTAQSLERALTRLDQIGRELDIGFLRDNLDSGEVEVSTGVLKILDLNSAELSSPPQRDQIMRHFSSKSISKLKVILGSLLAGEVVASSDIRLEVVTASGLSKIVSLRFWVELESGRPTFVNSVIVDISQLAQTEDRLRAQMAKHDQLFAIIGHELRTPASALKMLISDQSIGELEPHGGVIEETVDHLLNVLDDMRIITRPELVLESPEVRGSLPQMVRQSLPLLGRLMLEKGLRVTVEASPQSGSQCVVREQLLRQIVLNLVKNCALHSGATDLSILIESEDQDDAILFTLKFADNGRGISEEDRPLLFEAFKRGDTDSEGTGLGLHISQTYARTMLQGDLTYEPNRPKGTLFTLTVRCKKGSIELDNKERESLRVSDAKLLRGLRILFAEDSAVLRMMTVKVLLKKGAEVVVAEDGLEALELARRNDFDLVLTDIFMPNLDGYGLTAALRSELGFEGPVIGISAAVVGEEPERLIAAGANLVLAKPLSLDALNHAIMDFADLIPSRAAAIDARGKPKVLVIDDDPITLAMFVSILGTDYEVCTEEDSLQAVEVFKNLAPDIVLCDVGMPGMNGSDLLKRIHSLSPSTPIVQMSGNPDSAQYMAIAKTFGAAAILDKAAQPEQILGLVRATLAERSIQGANI